MAENLSATTDPTHATGDVADIGDKGDRSGDRSGLIANDLQYRVTRTAAREFEEALARLDQTEGHRAPEMRALMRAAMESQLEDLRHQLAEYDALRMGQIQVLELDSLTQLPEALIRARIAATRLRAIDDPATSAKHPRGRSGRSSSGATMAAATTIPNMDVVVV